MKSIKLIIAAILIAFVSVVQAQRTIRPSDIVQGKSIATWSKEWDFKAYQQTKEIYIKGMSQEAFIQAVRNKYPVQASESFKGVFDPYFEYIYNLHTRELTDGQVAKAITGNETALMCTELSSWNASHPGQLPQILRFPWCKFFEFLIEIARILVPIL